MIDTNTQQAKGCSREGKVEVPCFAIEGVACVPSPAPSGTSPAEIYGNGTARCRGRDVNITDASFFREESCKYVDPQNKYHFSTAMGLSVFLGMFGIDRFYLGYPAIGVAKLCTLGFFFIGQLIDIVLIALQIVGPADGSAYYTNHYSPVSHKFLTNNQTHIVSG